MMMKEIRFAFQLFIAVFLLSTL